MLRAMFLLALGGLVGPLQAAPPVHEFELDNGLKVVVKEDHRAPVVVSQVWYRVGSSYEHDGITGVSHVLEHMMFKGTENLAPGEFSRIIAAQGGRDNAFTGRDYTAYFQQLERERLEVSFKLEADRMAGLQLREEEFDSEMRVVREERRLRTDDNPQGLTFERFNAVAFLNSPYRIPVIGWMDDLMHLQLEDVQAWYDKWYAPNNAVLVVVGAIDPEEVRALAERHFGPVEPRPVPALKPRQEVEQKGTRRLVVQTPAELPYLIKGYKVPVLATVDEESEAYALEVLAGVLSGGDSARFPRELVRNEQVAAGARAGYNLYGRLESLFTVTGTPAQGRTIDELETALRGQIRRVREEPVTEAELERVKAQVVASAVYERDSLFYQAMQIGTLETIGLGWPRMDEYVERVRAVTAEQVQEVAQRYLTEDRLTVAVLDPLPLDPERPRPPAPMTAPLGEGDAIQH
jgi:zinc protease